MAINPMQLLSLKADIEGFRNRHPKFGMFFRDVASQMESGNVFEISLTRNDGSKIKTNIRISDEDIELIQKISSTISSQQ